MRRRRSSVDVLASDERRARGDRVGLGLTRRGFLGLRGWGGALVRGTGGVCWRGRNRRGWCVVVGDRIWVNVRASAPAQVKARLWPTANPTQVIETPWYATNRSDAARIPVPAASM